MIEQKKLSESIQKWGSSASIALLDPRCQIFTNPSVEGAIGYLLQNNHAVVFGDPVCSAANIPHLVNAFHDYSKENSKDLIYLTASENFAKWAISNGCQSLLEVEEELVIDPAAYPKKGSNGRLLHKKMNHAMRENVVIKEYKDKNPETKKKILEAESLWLQGRKGPQIFMSHFDFFENDFGKRCFYAEKNGRIVGVLFLNKLEAHKGWLLYLLLTVPDAPGGTSEYLLLTTLDKLADEDCHFLSFGVSASEKIGEVIGLGKFSTWLARIGFKVIKKIFPLDNRRSFWKKFEPQNRRSFILFSNPIIGYKEIFAVLKTVNAKL